MELKFTNSDEINDLLLKDMTPLAYCKQIIAYTVEQIRAYLNGKCPEKKFNALYFFESRQCSIFMKDHTKIIWDIEMTLEAVILPDLDEIEYVHFYSVPLIMEQAAKFGIDDDRSRMWVDFGICDLGRHIGDGICSGCEFDSIRGAFQDGEPYDRAVRQNPYHSGDYTALIRYWTEYSVQLNITRKAFHGTYFANTMDGAIGALVAEQILMSNHPEDRSLQYGKRRYNPKVVYVPIPQKNFDPIYSEEFMKIAGSYCGMLIDRLSLDAEGFCSGGLRYRKVKAITKFIYLYVYSLLRESTPSNFSIIEPVFTNHLKKQDRYSSFYQKELPEEIHTISHTDYTQKPPFDMPSTPLEHFQAAVWALTNSHFYLEAIKNILEFVNYQHSGKLAVILTGIFAGIYYQHYDIPKHYLTENRYYGRFSMSIVPLTHKVYDRSKQHQL